MNLFELFILLQKLAPSKPIVSQPTTSQFIFLHKKYILKNWSRQIQIMKLLDPFDTKWHFLMMEIFVLIMFNFTLLQLFVCLH